MAIDRISDVDVKLMTDFIQGIDDQKGSGLKDAKTIGEKIQEKGGQLAVQDLLDLGLSNDAAIKGANRVVTDALARWTGGIIWKDQYLSIEDAKDWAEWQGINKNPKIEAKVDLMTECLKDFGAKASDAEIGKLLRENKCSLSMDHLTEYLRIGKKEAQEAAGRANLDGMLRNSVFEFDDAQAWANWEGKLVDNPVVKDQVNRMLGFLKGFQPNLSDEAIERIVRKNECKLSLGALSELKLQHEDKFFQELMKQAGRSDKLELDDLPRGKEFADKVNKGMESMNRHMDGLQPPGAMGGGTFGPRDSATLVQEAIRGAGAVLQRVPTPDKK